MLALQRNCFHQSMYVLRCTLSVTCLIQLAYCLRYSYHKHTKRRWYIPKLISLFRSVVNCRNTKHDIDVTVKRRLSEHRKLVSLIKFVSTPPPLPLFKQTKTNFKKYLKRIEFNKEKWKVWFVPSVTLIFSLGLVNSKVVTLIPSQKILWFL